MHLYLVVLNPRHVPGVSGMVIRTLKTRDEIVAYFKLHDYDVISLTSHTGYVEI
jgi:hypothetical protein